MERTLAIIKPDAVASRQAGAILQRIEAGGFELRGMRLVHLTRAEAEGFYAVHRARPFFDSLTAFMSSGSAIVLALEADVKAVGGDMAGPIFDWPPYARVSETPEEVETLRAQYRASVRFCDRQLGRVLDFFDTHKLWADTALIVTTDHGFLLGEHDWWAKNRMYAYEEISHIPLFVHHPDAADRDGQRHGGLTQAIDLMPTLLDLHDVDCPDEVTGRSLRPAIMANGAVREHATFGYFGGGVNVTDGRFT